MEMRRGFIAASVIANEGGFPAARLAPCGGSLPR